MFVPLALAIVWFAPVPVQQAQQAHVHPAGEKLGTVRFTTSCSAAAQPAFTRGMALLHSFEFAPAIGSFTAAGSTDPGCAIAYWGIALSRWGNPFAAGMKTPAQLEAGRTAIEKAKAIGAKTERERDSLLKAGAILERLAVAQPDHPGYVHYLIHAYDVPPLAGKAIDGARRYAKIAPSAPHALHMPSHTFTRLGYWQDSIDTNIASAEAAQKEGSTAEQLHAMDYQAYAYLQTAQDQSARRLAAALPGLSARLDPNRPGSAAPYLAGVFAIAAIPARYALERSAWGEAAKLELHPSRFPQADAITWFARGLGGARSRDLQTARLAIDALQQLETKLTQAGESYWAEQVAIQRVGVTAWTTFAEGRIDEALTIMGGAAEREDRTEKNAVTPGPIAPARELLGYMLLEAKRPGEALAAFEITLKKEPNRFLAIAGAANAAAKKGDAAGGRVYAEQLVKVAARASAPNRPQLVAAKAVLGKG